MKQTETFNELHARTADVVKFYKTDFEHDRVLIEQFAAGTPFIHIARECGTHLYMLPPADDRSWPKENEKVRDLFARVDRWHMLYQNKGMMEYHNRNHATETWTYFNGRRLMKTNANEAMRIVINYINHVKREWLNGNRNV